MSEDEEFRGVGNVVSQPEGDLLTDAWAALSGLPDTIYYFESGRWFEPAILWEAKPLGEDKESFALRFEKILWRETTPIGEMATRERHGGRFARRWERETRIYKQYLDVKLEDALRRVDAYRATLAKYLQEEMEKAEAEIAEIRRFKETLRMRAAEVETGAWP